MNRAEEAKGLEIDFGGELAIVSAIDLRVGLLVEDDLQQYDGIDSDLKYRTYQQLEWRFDHCVVPSLE